MGKSEKQPDGELELSFEQALTNLEEIIQRMESGEAPLDSLVTNYQNGIKMLKFCRGKIEAAELKIKEVQEKDGVLIEKDFDNLV
jgi:exodeoxyribonuclease VII small subunit